MKTFVSPHSWFAFDYPENWFEFEEEADEFLFYDPNEWNGNLRISAYRDANPNYGQQCVADELKQKGARLVKYGPWSAVQTVERFSEEGQSFVTGHWLVGQADTCVECSFTTFADASLQPGEQIIASLKANPTGKYFHNLLIDVRLMEMMEIDDACAQIEKVAKKALKARFNEFVQSLEVLQKLVDGHELNQLGSNANVLLGLAFCSLMAENVDGFDWRTLIDGKMEKPVLVRDGQVVADPRSLFANKECPIDIFGTLDRLTAK